MTLIQVSSRVAFGKPTLFEEAINESVDTHCIMRVQLELCVMNDQGSDEVPYSTLHPGEVGTLQDALPVL